MVVAANGFPIHVQALGTGTRVGRAAAPLPRHQPSRLGRPGGGAGGPLPRGPARPARPWPDGCATSTAWGGVWTRPHFDRRTRSIVTLALLAGLGRDEEFRLHVRATRNTGATLADLSEVLMHVAVHAGVPAANGAMRSAKEVLKEVSS
jgi:alkylhydroperoxidase/carboxymuconolactone decarboxylase family protein YurZ